ncbi:MAG TPA: hypothetical protein VNC78_10350 [Actinomycetota bacterium]|nr:hypothetical protein [Actinomycetota bacterium]
MRGRVGKWLGAVLVSVLVLPVPDSAAADIQRIPDGRGVRPALVRDGDPSSRLLPTSPRHPFDILRTVSEVEELTDRVRRAQELELEEYSFAEAVHDLTGDGLDDVLLHRYSFTFDASVSPPVERTRTRISLLEGRTGRRIWTKRWASEGAGGSFAFEAITGDPARNGLFVMSVTETSGAATPMVYRFVYEIEALSPRGRSLWSADFESTWLFEIGVVTITGLLTLDVFDGIGGRQTDLLLGTGEYVEIGLTSVTDISAAVVDGLDGRSVAHPGRVHSVNFFPVPWPVGDLNEDRKQDYVFTMSGPYVGTDEENQPVVTTSGVLSARRGDDGSIIWDEPLDLGLFAYVQDGGDITGSDIADLLVSTVHISATDLLGLVALSVKVRQRIHLVEGSLGTRMWERPGEAALVPGDIDGDESRDVVTFAWISGRDHVGTKLRAYDSYGELLYVRRHELEHAATAAATWQGVGWWHAGDVHRDGSKDPFLWHEIGTGPRDLANETLVVDARDGRVDFRGGNQIQPLAAPLDHKGADLFEGCWTPPGSVGIAGLTGDEGRGLWSRSLAFELPLPPRGVGIYADAGRLARGAETDVVLNVWSPRAGYVVALDGRTGEEMWSLQVHGVPNGMSNGPADEVECDTS